MLRRRDFALGIGALGLASALPALAQKLRVMKVANTAAVNDPQQCFTTAGQHPKLNFYKPGGVDIEYVNMSSMTQAMQSLRSGHVDFGPAIPGILLPAMAKDPALDLVSVYKWLPRNANVIVVKPASGIKSAAELAGKRIGVRSLGDTGIAVTRTMLAELGLKDDKCEYIAIGDGAPAGAAIDKDRVDAMVAFDTAAARIELVGTRLRYVPLTPKFAQLGLDLRAAQVAEGRPRCAGGAVPRHCKVDDLLAPQPGRRHRPALGRVPREPAQGPQRRRGAQGARIHPQGPQEQLDAPA
jgi:NitT/TauT family transport system substrate-binding protein